MDPKNMVQVNDSNDLGEKPIVRANKNDGDAILAALGDEELVEVLSPQDDKRILRKIDFCLLPILFFAYLAQYLDKSALGFSAILGLRKDLHLVGQDYSWASAVFYFGYLVSAYPVSYLLVRLPIGKFMSCSIILWAGILMCTVAARNAAGLQGARFFLGFVEGAIAPSMTLLVSMYYRKSEQHVRHAIWFLGNCFGGLLGGLMGYGIGHIKSYSPWKALFLLFGGVTLFWGVIMMLTIPDTPLKARFLSKKDRVKAIERVQDNLTGFKSDKWKRYQFVEALTDPKSWFLVIFQLTQNIPNGAVSPFISIVIAGLGYNTFDTLLIQMVGNVYQITCVFVTMYGTYRWKNSRTIWMSVMTIISLIGTIVIRNAPASQPNVRFYAGYCFILAFSSNFPLTMAMITSNTGGFTKKATVSAMVFIGYCIGNIIGPQVMLAHEAPSYPTGFAITTASFGISALSALVLRFYCMWENKRRDALGVSSAVVDVGGNVVSHSLLNLVDKTDRELQEFRYVY